jgi:hypothetical protein
MSVSYETSPFAPARLFGPEPEAAAESYAAPAPMVSSPFAEALASYDEAQLEAETFEALRAEFEDEDFVAALQALADEVAARHLTAVGSWSEAERGMQLSAAEAEQWLEAVADRSDRLLAELETHFGQRPVESLTDGELEAVAGTTSLPQQSLGGPLDSQELFLGKLVGKVVKVVKGVGKVVGKLALGPLFGVLRKLVRPLLQRVLQRAIGKLPPDQRPIAEKLRGRFAGKQPESAAKGAKPAEPAPAEPAEPAPKTTDSPPAPAADAATEPTAQALAEDFDAQLAEVLLTQHEGAAEQVVARYEAEAAPPGQAGPYVALDAARQRLADQLIAADPAQPPIAELEEFIPVVMAAMKVIKLGVKVIGRPKVVGFIAKLLAKLIQGMVGEQPARVLSRHIANAGLRLLGLEAERADPTLGAEALVAAAEDTVREVLSMPAESLDNELLLEAAVQQAFEAAAVRHFPAEVLRPELTEASEAEDGERGIWIMFPRAARPHYRYKKYTVIRPLRITRAMARTVILTDGETLEDRLLEAGARGWPVNAETHHYQLLPGAEIGHLAAYELPGQPYAEAAQQFEQAPRPLAHPAHHPQQRTVVKLVVPGLALRAHPPFSVRLDLSGPRPRLRLHLHFAERAAHELAQDLAARRLAQVVATIRRHVGPAVREALAERLVRKLGRHQITLAEGRSRALAADLAEAVIRAVAEHLPRAAAALGAAAKDPAAGVTMSFAFGFDNIAALKQGKLGAPEVSVHPGTHRA